MIMKFYMENKHFFNVFLYKLKILGLSERMFVARNGSTLDKILEDNESILNSYYYHNKTPGGDTFFNYWNFELILKRLLSNGEILKTVLVNYKTEELFNELSKNKTVSKENVWVEDATCAVENDPFINWGDFDRIERIRSWSELYSMDEYILRFEKYLSGKPDFGKLLWKP